MTKNHTDGEDQEDHQSLGEVYAAQARKAITKVKAQLKTHKHPDWREGNFQDGGEIDSLFV